MATGSSLQEILNSLIKNKKIIISNEHITPFFKEGTFGTESEQSIRSRDSVIGKAVLYGQIWVSTFSALGSESNRVDKFIAECEKLINFYHEHWIKHPCVVDVLGIACMSVNTESDDQLLCLVTEYMDETLFEFLQRKKKKNFSQLLSVKLASDIACGLMYLHSLGIIHCGLSCNNIAIVHIGQTENVKAKIMNLSRARKEDSKWDPPSEDLDPYIPDKYHMHTLSDDNLHCNKGIDMYSFGKVLDKIARNTPSMKENPLTEIIRQVTPYKGEKPEMSAEKAYSFFCHNLQGNSRGYPTVTSDFVAISLQYDPLKTKEYINKLPSHKVPDHAHFSDSQSTPLQMSASSNLISSIARDTKEVGTQTDGDMDGEQYVNIIVERSDVVQEIPSLPEPTQPAPRKASIIKSAFTKVGAGIIKVLQSNSDPHSDGKRDFMNEVAYGMQNSTSDSDSVSSLVTNS